MKKFYDEIVRGNSYNYEAASKHTDVMKAAKIKAKDMPAIEAKFISKNHVGCCLHYGMALFKKLREEGIEAYIAITEEESFNDPTKKDSHVSVCYVKGGERFIADPVETVKLGKGDYFDIPIDIFRKEQGIIWLYDPYGEHGNELFFEEFILHPFETIMAE